MTDFERVVFCLDSSFNSSVYALSKEFKRWFLVLFWAVVSVSVLMIILMSATLRHCVRLERYDGNTHEYCAFTNLYLIYGWYTLFVSWIIIR